MRPIDADALIIKVQELIKEYERRMPKYSANDMLTSGKDAAMKWGYKADGVEDALKLIIDAPIIKAEAIKHAWWLPHKITASLKCSECRRVFADETPYCPNCGARMDGGGIND